MTHYVRYVIFFRKLCEIRVLFRKLYEIFRIDLRSGRRSPRTILFASYVRQNSDGCALYMISAKEGQADALVDVRLPFRFRHINTICKAVPAASSLLPCQRAA